MHVQSIVSMWLRALLWIAAAVLPGGLLLLPLLVADELTRRRAEPASLSDATAGDERGATRDVSGHAAWTETVRHIS